MLLANHGTRIARDWDADEEDKTERRFQIQILIDILFIRAEIRVISGPLLVIRGAKLIDRERQDSHCEKQ